MMFGGTSERQKAQATKALINYWLVPNDKYKAFSVTSTYDLLFKLYKACDRGKVQSYVKAMDYPEFLSTPYWITFSKYMRMNEECDKCKSVRGLELHHKTYKHIGLEILYQSDMQVLCKTCHAKEHSK
jgi:hypothetical protein